MSDEVQCSDDIQQPSSFPGLLRGFSILYEGKSKFDCLHGIGHWTGFMSGQAASGQWPNISKYYDERRRNNMNI